MAVAAGRRLKMKDVLTGKSVRLSAFDPEEMSKAWPRWYRNSEYFRLLFSSARPLYSPKAELKWMEEEVGELSPANYFFAIRTLAEDKLIGELALEVVDWSGREAFVGLGIGETEYWSKGYGTDVMNVLLRFAFAEVNLKRVSLGVFAYNPRAVRSYEKAGFRHEGQMRQLLRREGRRWDNLYMGILREEWLELNQE
jgi:RimJ/RimL family protein N-acetyltransferase